VDRLKDIHKELDDISGKLITQLRSDSDNELKWSCKLKYNVKAAFVDVTFVLDEWIIAIENKIYADSASDEKQLIREYEGLKKKNPTKKVGLIFLVPFSNQDGEVLNDKIQKEFDALYKLAAGDFKQLVTWQKNPLGYPSVSSIIESILEDESKGLIEPIPEYTKHTLKALNVFIGSDFEGYYYDGYTRYSGNNENTEENLTVSELTRRDSGFVGVQNGLSGLMLMDKDKLLKRTFQYTNTDISKRNNWLPIDLFQKVSSWMITGKEPDIIWNTALPARLLYKIAKECLNTKVYIGMQGGLKALESMSPDVIAKKRWGIKAADTPPTSQWIEGEKFVEVIEKKQAI